MRWQRSITGTLNRWSDQVDPFGHELRDLAPIVVPTVQLGTSPVDPEWSTFRASVDAAAVGGQAGFIVVAPVSAPIQVLAVTGASPGGASGFDVQLLPVLLALGSTPTAPGGLFERSSGRSGNVAFIDQGTAVGVVPGIYQVGGNAVLQVELPAQTLIDVGFALAVKADRVNQAMRFSVWWRNLAG